MNNNYNSNTVVKQDFAIVKQVDGRAAHMTDTTRHQSWQSTPPPPHKIMLDPSLSLYSTRLSAKSSFSHSQPHTNYGKFNIQFIGPKTWNDIDESIKSLSASSFKNNLKQQLIDYNQFRVITICVAVNFLLLCFVLSCVVLVSVLFCTLSLFSIFFDFVFTFL